MPPLDSDCDCFGAFFNLCEISCRLCSSPIKSKDQFLQHCSDIHGICVSCKSCGSPTSGLLNCELCGKGFDNDKKWRQHQIEVHQLPSDFGYFKCRYCNEENVSNSELEQHIRQCHPLALSYHCCKECHSFFTFPASLQKHIAQRHPETAFICEICDQKTGSMTSLKTHLAKSHSKATFSCDICHKRFSCPGNLKSHILKSHLKSKDICSYCTFSIDSPDSYKAHLASAHYDRLPDHTCGICAKVFGTTRDKSYHEAMVHSSDGSSTCQECDKSFKSVLRLRRHVAYFHRKERRAVVKCNFCDYRCHDRNVMNRHEQSVHAKSKMYMCDACGKGFSVKGNLKQHIERVHQRPQLFSCSHCLKQLSSEKSMKSHIRNVHEAKPRDIQLLK